MGRCRVLPFRPSPLSTQRPALTIGQEISELIARRLRVDPSAHNLDTIEQAAAVPIAAIALLSQRLPSWCFTSPGAPGVGQRIAEA